MRTIIYNRKNIFFLLIVSFSLLDLFLQSNIESKLTGIYISSDLVDSANVSLAFDDDYSTIFKSSKESNGWIGIELQSESVITKIGWALNEEYKNKTNYLLGVFEGANDPTFIDALPLFMITEESLNSAEINFQEISISQPFKYIRYVGPNQQHCVISELQFFGYENISLSDQNEEEKLFYQPTELPLIVINTENSVEPYDKENEIKSNILIIKDKKIYKNVTGGVRLRGNGTMNTEKKPYRIKFDSKQKLFDFPAKAKKWTLLANYSDKTLIRNTLAFKISQLFSMKYTPSCRPVDLMLNGEYKGNYILCDQVEVNEGRVEITEMKKSITEEPEITGGYFLEADAYAESEKSYFKSNKGNLITIKYPDEDDINEPQKNWIKSFFNEVENKIYSRIHNVENIDKESFIKYFLIKEFSGEPDFSWSSFYMTKERNDSKLYFGPAWDFDLAFDNDYHVYPTNNRTNFTFFYRTSGTFSTFLYNILKNESIISLLKSEWKEITENGTFTKDILINFIDDKANEINNSQKLNFIRWNILNKKIYLNPVIIETYTEEVEFLKEYIIGRFDSLSKLIERLTPIIDPEPEIENEIETKIENEIENEIETKIENEIENEIESEIESELKSEPDILNDSLVEIIQDKSSEKEISSYLSIRIKYLIVLCLLFF